MSRGGLDEILQFVDSASADANWERAMRDILFFIRCYVPKHLFNIDLAAPQQIALLVAVQNGIDKLIGQYFLIRAPRKGGKTILVAIIVVWVTLREQTRRAFIVSGGKEQAEWLYNYCRDIIWPGGPEGASKREFFSQFLRREPMNSRTLYNQGGWIRYAAASKKQVNAPTADILVMDEYVQIPTDIIEQAWPMIRQSLHPMRFLLSTATGGQENSESFLDLIENAEELGFQCFEWEPEDCAFLQTKAAAMDDRIAERILSADMYETQYKGGLPKRAGKIFPRTLIRGMFYAPDKDRPGFLVDGSPYQGDEAQGMKRPGEMDNGIINQVCLQFQGESKGAVDWGFDDDTCVMSGYRGLDHKLHIMDMVVGDGTTASEWADVIQPFSLEHNIRTWYCDSAGAFQNQELRSKGLHVVPRAFGAYVGEGKEWMIGIAYHWLRLKFVVCPDTPKFEPLKKQLTSWRRGSDGKPRKGNDHCCDGFIELMSGWDPRYYGEKQVESEPIASNTKVESKATDWSSFQSPRDAWKPSHWENNERKQIGEK